MRVPSLQEGSFFSCCPASTTCRERAVKEGDAIKEMLCTECSHSTELYSTWFIKMVCLGRLRSRLENCSLSVDQFVQLERLAAYDAHISGVNFSQQL